MLWIGTSGWVYKHWMGDFYPAKLPGSEQLPFYAQHFPTVEINFSFYRLPERSVFESWHRQTPDAFRFAVKASRYLTHLKKLKQPEVALERLLERAGGLQEKLGPILFQLPPNWSLDFERLQAFLELLPVDPQRRYVFEFRHPSWLSDPVYQQLQQVGAALCLPVSPDVPIAMQLTTSWTYIRMHRGQWGIGYQDDELSLWSDRIRSFLQQGLDVYVYFNNDTDGHAIRDARRLAVMLQSKPALQSI